MKNRLEAAKGSQTFARAGQGMLRNTLAESEEVGTP